MYKDYMDNELSSFNEDRVRVKNVQEYIRSRKPYRVFWRKNIFWSDDFYIDRNGIKDHIGYKWGR